MRLWIDTNVARSTVKMRDLSRLAQRKGVAVIVHPQVYLEMRRQMRVEKNDGFKQGLFDGFLRQHRVNVFTAVIDQLVAASWADELFQRYPTKEAWEGAKQRTLGGELRKGFEVEPGQMPMTTDWLIALTIESEPQSWIITHDKREEWKFLRDSEPKRALRWDEAMEWLVSLPEQAP
jgi:uncharacterized Zn-finger protein